MQSGASLPEVGLLRIGMTTTTAAAAAATTTTTTSTATTTTTYYDDCYCDDDEIDDIKCCDDGDNDKSNCYDAYGITAAMSQQQDLMRASKVIIPGHQSSPYGLWAQKP